MKTTALFVFLCSVLYCFTTLSMNHNKKGLLYWSSGSYQKIILPLNTDELFKSYHFENVPFHRFKEGKIKARPTHLEFDTTNKYVRISYVLNIPNKECEDFYEPNPFTLGAGVSYCSYDVLIFDVINEYFIPSESDVAKKLIYPEQIISNKYLPIRKKDKPKLKNAFTTVPELKKWNTIVPDGMIHIEAAGTFYFKKPHTVKVLGEYGLIDIKANPDKKIHCMTYDTTLSCLVLINNSNELIFILPHFKYGLLFYKIYHDFWEGFTKLHDVYYRFV